jgi:serine/threonine protein kinase
LIKKILNTDPKTRLTVIEIWNHEWFNQIKSLELDGIIVGKDRIPVIQEILLKLEDFLGNNSLPESIQYI